jgi:hypothetical protein
MNPTKAVLSLLVAFGMAFLCAAQAREALIDLTPGGFTPDHPPQVFVDWLNQHFEHDAIHLANEYYPSGWDPALHGPPAFISTPLGVPIATFSWNLLLLRKAEPLFNRWVFTGGPDPNDIGWINMYAVATGSSEIFGAALVTINGAYPITALAVYGTERPHAQQGTLNSLTFDQKKQLFLKEIGLK